VRGAAGGAARWPPKRLSFILQFNLHNSYFILALPPGGATGGGEKSGTRLFIGPIRSFKPTPERNPMARSASAQRLMARQLLECMLRSGSLQSRHSFCLTANGNFL
jgi:hypothetical protein